jgi:integrase
VRYRCANRPMSFKSNTLALHLNYRFDNLIPKSDTQWVKTAENENSEESPWQKTKYANLVRYKPSGKYFIRAKCGGKLIRESLDTDSITVAKTRLDNRLQEEREAAQRRTSISEGKVTFGDALTMFRNRIQGDPSLTPGSKRYYEERITALLKSWPDLQRQDIRKITKTQCLNWAAEFGKKYSPNAYNHTTSIIKKVFAIGKEVGARCDNPAEDLKWVPDRKKPLVLPTKAEFNSIVENIRHAGGGRSHHCADLVMFLAYGGFRIGEARNILWRDILFDKEEILVRGDEVTGTKNGEFRYVPMSPTMLTLLERLKLESGGNPKPDAPVMQVRECQKAIDRAVKELGLRRFTHHDLRHLFITWALENNTPPLTVAEWVGHNDKGVLVLKTYGHLQKEHSKEMAAKLNFPSPKIEPLKLNRAVKERVNVTSGNENPPELLATA